MSFCPINYQEDSKTLTRYSNPKIFTKNFQLDSEAEMKKETNKLSKMFRFEKLKKNISETNEC